MPWAVGVWGVLKMNSSETQIVNRLYLSRLFGHGGKRSRPPGAIIDKGFVMLTTRRSVRASPSHSAHFDHD